MIPLGKRFDSVTGNILESYADDYTAGFIDADGEAWHIVRQRILKIDPFKPIEEIDTPINLNWMWVMPDGFDPNTILRIEHVGSSHLLIICEKWAGVIEIPSEPSEVDLNRLKSLQHGTLHREIAYSQQ